MVDAPGLKERTHRSAARLSQLHYVRIATERERERDTHIKFIIIQNEPD